MSEFHVNQCIHLPVFCPKRHASYMDRILHALDVRRALSFYLRRTHAFLTSRKLFVAIAV